MKYDFLIIVSLAIFGGGGILVLLVLMGSIRQKGRWGINLNPTLCCPKCGEDLKMIRKPTSFRQAAWGGNTCPKCGCEIDKWGIEVLEENQRKSNEG